MPRLPMLALLLVAVAVGLVASPAAEAKKKTKPCQIARSKTVASNGQARIYTKAMPDGKAAADGARGTYACLLANRRSFLLGQTYEEGDLSGTVSPVALAGRYVAFVVTTNDASCKAACPDFEPTKRAVRVADVKTRKLRVLDTGAGIVVASLVVRGVDVYWTNGGLEKTAPLSGKNPASCTPPGTSPMASSDQVRVYSKALPGGAAGDQSLYACWTATRRTTLFAANTESDTERRTIDPIRFSGRFVVYAVTVFRLACKAQCTPEDKTTTIRVLDAERGERRTLASGSSIDPASLNVVGGTVSWTDAGVAKTATLS
jgi:hypothetical protein